MYMPGCHTFKAPPNVKKLVQLMNHWRQTWRHTDQIAGDFNCSVTYPQMRAPASLIVVSRESQSLRHFVQTPWRRHVSSFCHKQSRPLHTLTQIVMWYNLLTIPRQANVFQQLNQNNSSAGEQGNDRIIMASLVRSQLRTGNNDTIRAGDSRASCRAQRARR